MAVFNAVNVVFGETCEHSGDCVVVTGPSKLQDFWQCSRKPQEQVQTVEQQKLHFAGFAS
jgi:hypothetical protein